MAQIPARPNRSLPRGCLFGILTLLLSLALTASTALVQRRYFPVCGGGLSAGYPIVFICDDSGGSPISSWGRIDAADWGNLNLPAFTLDFLLYEALLWLAWAVVTELYDKGASREENFRWELLICVACMAVFLFAFLSFQSSSLNFEYTHPRTPTPVTAVIPSPTPIGTSPLPSPAMPTLGP